MASDTKIAVYIYVSSPPKIRLVFPDPKSAERYYFKARIIKAEYLLSKNPALGSKSDDSDVEVVLRLPSSVRKVESSRSLGGFVLYFDSPERARLWVDPVCCTVSKEPELLVIKQYWQPGELSEALKPSRLVPVDRNQARDPSRKRGTSGTRHDDRDTKWAAPPHAPLRSRSRTRG